MVSLINASTEDASFPLLSVKPPHSRRRTVIKMAILLMLAVLFGGGWLDRAAFAQSSLMERLSGFDSGRVERAGRWVQQPGDPDTFEEASKLVYQLRRVDAWTLEFAPEGSAVEPGDAVRLRGTAIDIAALPLPRELADSLEMPRLFRVTIDVDGTNRYVMTERVPRRWLRSSEGSKERTAKQGNDAGSRSGASVQAGQSGWACATEGIVCAVDAEGRPLILAATAMQWYPTSLEHAGAVGVALLARQGFDARLLDEIVNLQQQPLQSDERDAFYGMLQAAGTLNLANSPAPEPTGTVELLRKPRELTGHWIRVPLQTVRITRVAVTTSDLLARLGQDHFWQIDGMGSLGDLVVTVEVAEDNVQRLGDEPPQAAFSNRYPVSVAALRLPDELRDRMEQESGAGAVVTMLRQPITVDGFYYRLWSYDSEFMQRSTGRQQFGPLLMASRIRLQPAVEGDPLGVAMIGWVAAAVFLTAIAVVIAVLWWTARRDDEVTRRRRSRDAENVRFPST